jgi:hypothetical protein
LASTSLLSRRKPSKATTSSNPTPDPPPSAAPTKSEEQRRAELAIFDFTESSPPAPSRLTHDPPPKDLLKSRLSRRHSSMSEVRPGPAAGERERRGGGATNSVAGRTKEVGTATREDVPGASAGAPAGAAAGVSRSLRGDARRRSMVL